MATGLLLAILPKKKTSWSNNNIIALRFENIV